MTAHDDFDGLIADRLRADAPAQAPAGLLTSAMNRIDATPQRRRPGFLGGAPWRMLAAAAVVLLAVVAGSQLAGLVGRGPDVGTSPTPVPSDASSPTPSAEAPGSTAPSPSPSPEAAHLMLRLVAGGGGPTSPAQLLPWATVMSDGTVIWQPVPAPAETPTLLVRRLTPDGLADLRERIFASGLLDESAAHELEHRPGAPEPPGRGVAVYQFTTGGDEPATVTSVQWLGDEEEATYYQPSPERRELDALARALRDPEALVGADAWAGPAEPYVASDYQLVLTPYPDLPPYGTTDASQIPWPFDGPLDEFGEPVDGPAPPVSRCDVISRDDAAAIVDALEAGGFGEVGLDRATVASLDWAEGGGTVDVFVMPRMPDGFPECSDQVS